MCRERWSRRREPRRARDRAVARRVGGVRAPRQRADRRHQRDRDELVALVRARARARSRCRVVSLLRGFVSRWTAVRARAPVACGFGAINLDLRTRTAPSLELTLTSVVVARAPRAVAQVRQPYRAERGRRRRLDARLARVEIRRERRALPRARRRRGRAARERWRGALSARAIDRSILARRWEENKTPRAQRECNRGGSVRHARAREGGRDLKGLRESKSIAPRGRVRPPCRRTRCGFKSVFRRGEATMRGVGERAVQARHVLSLYRRPSSAHPRYPLSRRVLLAGRFVVAPCPLAPLARCGPTASPAWASNSTGSSTTRGSSTASASSTSAPLRLSRSATSTDERASAS